MNLAEDVTAWEREIWRSKPKRDRHERTPKGCESETHEGRCRGYLRTCPSCTRRVCDVDGAHDDADRALPGVCDACVSAGTLPETTA